MHGIENNIKIRNGIRNSEICSKSDLIYDTALFYCCFEILGQLVFVFFSPTHKNVPDVLH